MPSGDRDWTRGREGSPCSRTPPGTTSVGTQDDAVPGAVAVSSGLTPGSGDGEGRGVTGRDWTSLHPLDPREGNALEGSTARGGTHPLRV